MIFTAMTYSNGKIYLDREYYNKDRNFLRLRYIEKNVRWFDGNKNMDIPIIEYYAHQDNEIDDVDSDVYFNGYFQNYKLFKHNIENIRREFECPKDIKNTISELYGDIENYCVINVRLGDYIKYNKEYFTVPTKEWYILQYEKHCSGMKCLIVSDDVKKCREMFDGQQFEFADRHKIVDKTIIDFYLVVMCKKIICSASTFSLTGAILNKNEQCIVPNPFYQHKYDGVMKTVLIPDYAIKEDVEEFYEK